MRRASVTVHAPLVMGLAMPVWSISCMAPRPSSLSGADPLIDSTGLSAWRAAASPGIALAKPGVVYIATPG